MICRPEVCCSTAVARIQRTSRFRTTAAREMQVSMTPPRDLVEVALKVHGCFGMVTEYCVDVVAQCVSDLKIRRSGARASVTKRVIDDCCFYDPASLFGNPARSAYLQSPRDPSNIQSWWSQLAPSTARRIAVNPQPLLCSLLRPCVHSATALPPQA